MSARFRLEFELPDDPLQHLLDVQDVGTPLTNAERREAEGWPVLSSDELRVVSG